MKKGLFALGAVVMLGMPLHSAHASKFHLGFTTDTVVGTGSTTVPAISMLFPLGDKLALQTNFGISSISSFNFSAGGAVKYTVAGDANKGFHLGGGLGLGLTGASQFFLNILGNVGFHFNLVEGVLISVDGGVGVAINATAGTTNVTLGANSANTLGMSVLFRL